MSFIRETKRRAKALIAPAVFVALTGYFGWNATRGNRGLEAYALRQGQLRAADADLAKVQVEQRGWERRVAALRTKRLDLDALDERARAMLNLAEPTDIVVPYGPTKRLF